MNKIISTYILVFISLIVFGQKKVQFTDPVKLNTSVNSEAEESAPLLSFDGKSMYFTRTFHPENVGGKIAGQDIWISQGSGIDNWSPATNNFPLINNKNNNSVIGQSKDGKILYLLNIYSKGSYMDYGISSWDITSTAPPVEMDIPALNIQGNYYGFYMHPDGELLLISAEMERSKGQEDIYIAVKDTNGVWQKPINAGGAINSSGFELSPYISDDFQTLYFSSSGRGGSGDADIFMSTRRNEKWNSWRPAKNMGKTINSKGFDAYFTITDGQAYFCSNRESGLSDIYYSRIISNEELISMIPDPSEVFFSLNSYIINAESKPLLDDLVNLLKEKEDLKVVVCGYTCRLGNELDNLKLAELRAGSVSDYLQIQGIDDDRIEVQAAGDNEARKLPGDEKIQKEFRKVIITFKYI